MQTSSFPANISLTPPFRILISVLQLNENINCCICYALVDPRRRQLFQAPVSMHFMASAILLGLVADYGLVLQMGQF